MVIATHQSSQSIDPWVFRELGLASLGDARALRLASDLAALPELSLSSAYQSDWAGLKAGYRVFDNPKVTSAKLLVPHQAATWERAATDGIVLVAQETTYFNFTQHAATTGLGPIGPGPDHGLLLHSALALTTKGVPLAWSVSSPGGPGPVPFCRLFGRGSRGVGTTGRHTKTGPETRTTVYATRCGPRDGQTRGALGRKSDGEPGVKTLWQRYRQLQLLVWWDEVPRNLS